MIHSLYPVAQGKSLSVSWKISFVKLS
jgi:hypothetical protein